MILDLYRFCNEWNYFNVGSNLYKQIKGVSMGCYFSKEISDLVLLYSEYKYLLVSDESKLRVLRRYADDGFALFSINNSDDIISEMRKLMAFYPSNLIINIKLNRVHCEYLDLHLSIDDITAVEGRIHYRTFFKKFHKFAYLNPTSNHAKHVFKGLIRTECLRYARNSLTKEDYYCSVGLFSRRLSKVGYKGSFLQKHMLSYEEGLKRTYETSFTKEREKKVIISMIFDRDDMVSNLVESLLGKARKGLNLGTRIVIAKKVKPKLRNIFSTRRMLHRKMEQFGSL